MGPQRYAEVVDGSLIRERRQERNLSLRQLAFMVGRPNSYTFLSRLERGLVKSLTPHLAYRLIRALDIKPESSPRYFRFHGISRSFRSAA